MNSSPENTGENSPKELRILLWGKTGVGKSSVGNAILGKEAFTAERSPESVTKRCSRETEDCQQHSVVVVDTPGLFHTQENKYDLEKELVECFSLLAPGPHVILLVVKLGKFTNEDDKVLKSFKKGFNDELHHTLIVFTHRNNDNNESKVRKFIQSHKSLDEFINQRSVDYHVFKIPDVPDHDDPQVKDLLKKITEMVEKNGGQPYSNDVIKEIVKKLEELKSDPEMMSEFEKKQQYVLALLEKKFPGVSQLQKFLKLVQDQAMKFMPED